MAKLASDMSALGYQLKHDSVKGWGIQKKNIIEKIASKLGMATKITDGDAKPIEQYNATLATGGRGK